MPESAVDKWIKSTKETLRKIEEYQLSPKPIIVTKDDVYQMVAQVLDAASPLVPSPLSVFFKGLSKFLVTLSKDKNIS